MSSSSENKTMIRLKSSNNNVFEVEKSVATQMNTIKHIMDKHCAGRTSIPVPFVTSEILAKVIEYCKKYAEANESELSVTDQAALEAWDSEFVKVDPPTLFDIAHAANYLEHKGLHHLTFQAVTDLVTK